MGLFRKLQHKPALFLSITGMRLDRIVALAEKETQRRRGRINNVEDFVKEYPELSILIDGTEQPKQRPQDKQKRKSDYSGKKRRHTLKQIITATSKGIILAQSPCGRRGTRCGDAERRSGLRWSNERRRGSCEPAGL